MQDSNSNGKVDRVLATFSESLAAYSAGTTPWTLANVPSGGTLASVSVSAAVATLTITEGAGAPDTAVGSFTVASCHERDRDPRCRRQPLLVCGDRACGRRQAGPRRGHARHAGRHCERQGRSRAGDLLGDARRLDRHRSLDAHERPLVAERSRRSPPRERPPRSSSPRAPAPRTPPSAPSASSSPRARPASTTLPATSPRSPRPLPSTKPRRSS